MRDLISLKYIKDGELRKIRIISQACHKWKTIADLVCDDPSIESRLEQEYNCDPEACFRQLFIDHFIMKMPENYSSDWYGLFELLDDADLGFLAEQARNALLVNV